MTNILNQQQLNKLNSAIAELKVVYTYNPSGKEIADGFTLFDINFTDPNEEYTDKQHDQAQTLFWKAEQAALKDNGFESVYVKELDEYRVFKSRSVLVYNGENTAITIVTDGNADVVVQPKSFATIETDATFNSDSFYVQEDGEWYAKENGDTGADFEIYSGN